MRILYPRDYLPTTNPHQSALIEEFTKGLENVFQVEREYISLADQWKEDLPDGPDHADIAEYLKLVQLIHYYPLSKASLTRAFRLADIRTTTIRITTFKNLHKSTKSDSESHRLFREQCTGSGKFSLPISQPWNRFVKVNQSEDSFLGMFLRR